MSPLSNQHDQVWESHSWRYHLEVSSTVQKVLAVQGTNYTYITYWQVVPLPKQTCFIEKKLRNQARIPNAPAVQRRSRIGMPISSVWFGLGFPNFFNSPLVFALSQGNCNTTSENLDWHKLRVHGSPGFQETIAKKLLKPFRNSINTINTPSTPSRNTNHLLQTN